jgi:transposase
MPLRGSYKKIPKESRDRVLRAAQNGNDWKAVAVANDVPYRTAYGWLMNGGQPLKERGGDKRSKLSGHQLEVIISWLEINPQLSLKSLRERVEQEMGVEVTQQTISNRLDGSLISVKKVHYQPLGVNSENNRQLRSIFVQRILESTAANKMCIYIDETNFNLFCR